MSTWFDVITAIFGDAAVLLLAIFGVLLALGVYKLVKDWLPF